LAGGGLRPYLRPFPGLLLPLPYRAPPGRPGREPPVPGRLAVLACRGRPAVPLRGRAAPSRERAAFLGARVAMIPTVASFPAAAQHSQPWRVASVTGQPSRPPGGQPGGCALRYGNSVQKRAL